MPELYESTRHVVWMISSVLVLAAISTADIPPPRHIKLRGPPIYPPAVKFQSKRVRGGPVRVHHIHLNYPPPPIPSRPIKYIPAPPRKYKPNIKSHFNPSPPAHFITPIIDNNEGAIHTIPAPNLGPNGDRPIPPPALVASTAGVVLPYENIVKEGAYEVHENVFSDVLRGQQPYYAPDPDPSLPAPQVPVTRDPHSHPSNGKAPLDLILQQQLETHQHNLAKVSYSPTAPHVLNYPNDPNSQFLQAFQDQYKYQAAYDGEYQASELSNRVTSSPNIDYDSGAEVNFSFDHAFQDQQDAASEMHDETEEDEEEEILEDSGATFGQRIKTQRKEID